MTNSKRKVAVWEPVTCVGYLAAEYGTVELVVEDRGEESQLDMELVDTFKYLGKCHLPTRFFTVGTVFLR